MPKAEFRIDNIPKVSRALKKKQKLYKQGMQEDIGEFLDLVRRVAGEEIMIAPKGKTFFERRKVRSTPGKLTVRTGRMRYLLKQDLKASWSGKGKILYKKNTSAFKMQARVIKKNKVDSGFIATIRIYISNIPNKVSYIGSGRRKMPAVTKLTLKMRFSWEYRGRPYLHPASVKKLNVLRYKIQSNIDMYLGGVV